MNIIFTNNSRIIKAELNKISLLVEYMLIIRDKTAKETFNSSRKLSEMRLAIAQRCLRKV